MTEASVNTRVDAEVQGGVTEAEGPQMLSWDSKARRWVVVYIPLIFERNRERLRHGALHEDFHIP